MYLCGWPVHVDVGHVLEETGQLGETPDGPGDHGEVWHLRHQSQQGALIQVTLQEVRDVAHKLPVVHVPSQVQQILYLPSHRVVL